MHPSIFKAYDIRGVYGEDFTTDDAEHIAAAVVAHTGARRVIVGRDMRTSSPHVADAVLRGVCRSGADALDIGLCSTPMFNYAVVQEAGADAGIMVSASHNPARYNGFKMDYGDGLPISAATGMEEVKRLALNPPPHLVSSSAEAREGGRGGVEQRDVLVPYLDRIMALIPPASLAPRRMVVDCGNGMGGLTMEHLADRIPGHIERLYWELDGTFPNHEPNPIKAENVIALMAAVRDSGADVGFAYDGDADRIGVVDERGRLVRGDLLTVLLAREALKRNPGATILYDLRSSRVVAEEVRRSGGVPIATRVGHALIKKHLREVGAVFGGELSNHFYFGEFHGMEATEYAMLLFLRIMGERGERMSELIAPLQRYHHSGEINFTVDDADAVFAALAQRYRGAAREVSTLDGFSFDMGSWWFNVRPSNTEPLVRLVVECATQRECEARVEEIASVIRGE
ncbi:MAG: phosphomannomutase/phosphoglucomutase [bacterium]|nr:phosphomannomutase/phosphoglucomutase [bacterium]